MFSPKRTRSAWLAGAAVAVSAIMYMPCARSAEPATGTEAKSEMKRDFLSSAAQVDIAEVQFAKLAERKAQDPEVKALALHMSREHSKNLSALEKLAAKQNMKLPQKLDPEPQKVHDKLEKLSGKDFDQEYVHASVECHKRGVDLFDYTSRSEENPDFRTFAANMLPGLQEHLRNAQKIESKLASNAVKEPAAPTSVSAPEGKKEQAR